MTENSFYKGVQNLVNYLVPEIEQLRKGREIGISYYQAYKSDPVETAFLTITGTIIQLVPAVVALATSAYFCEIRDQPLVGVAAGLVAGAVANRLSFPGKDVLHIANKISERAGYITRWEASHLERACQNPDFNPT